MILTQFPHCYNSDVILDILVDACLPGPFEWLHEYYFFKILNFTNLAVSYIMNVGKRSQNIRYKVAPSFKRMTYAASN